jgi:NADPH:quinone reductase-like Zn-dependent oxidoreductase
MKAFIVDRYGKHSGRIDDVPEPELGDEDLLVQVTPEASHGARS